MRLRSLRLRALALLAVACCSRPSTIDVGFNGSAEGMLAAELAAEAWNQTCGLELVVVHRGEGDVALREQEGLSNDAFGETTLERPFLGILGPKEPVRIWFMSGSHALPTLTHEFGHALGLGHAPAGIMRAGVGYDALDPATENRTIAPGMITPEDCARVAP